MLPNLEAVVHQTGYFGPVALVAIAAFLLAESMLLIWADRRRKQGKINQRLSVQAKTGNEQEALFELRRRRGLNAVGHYQLPFIAFNRLVMQSGISIPIGRLMLLMVVSCATGVFMAYSLTGSLFVSVAAAAVLGLIVPVAMLLAMRARRRKLFESQLPEAIDVMVRSLKAGHPLTVAISVVAREMADPIGSEFGIVADEMTYGLDLDSALSNLRTRAGQSDLSFFVVAVSIQQKTGGNLAEILTNLSRMVRERGRMRRKIHSLSSEGRFSAIALSVIPCFIYGAISLTSPGYFKEVESDPLFMQAVYVGLGLWLMGVYVMRRMVNFRI
jgi:tight adherence protein B